jgi:hypothetical protein
MEGEIVLARVVQTVRLQPLDPVVPRPVPYATLRPRSAVRMRVLGAVSTRVVALPNVS